MIKVTNLKIEDLIGTRVYQYDDDCDIIRCATIGPDYKFGFYWGCESFMFDLRDSKTKIRHTSEDTIIKARNRDNIIFTLHTNILKAI